MITKILLSTFTLFLLLNTQPVTSQIGEELQYRLRAKLPVSILNKYKFTESQKVNTALIIGDTEELYPFERELKVDYSYRATTELDDGFKEVDIKVDSVRYNFDSEKDKITYNSFDWRNAIPPIQNKDYQRYGLTLQYDYDFIYSPYSEVSKVVSPNYEANKDIFTNTKVFDETSMKLLKEYYTDKMVAFIFDPYKNILPDNDVTLDDTWSPEVNIEMGGYWLEMNPEFKIESYDRSGFLIEARLDSIPVGQDEIYMVNIGDFGTVEKSEISGIISAFFTTQGVMESVVINIDAVIEGSTGGRDFRQEQNAVYSWELLGSYQF